MGLLENIVYKLPKDISLSPDIRERAEAYFTVVNNGVTYYIPITKEFKKVWKLRRRKNRYYFDCSWAIEHKLRDFIRDIVSSVYLQIRDSVGESLYQTLSQEIREGFEKMVSDYLAKRIEKGLDTKLLAPKPKG